MSGTDAHHIDSLVDKHFSVVGVELIDAVPFACICQSLWIVIGQGDKLDVGEIAEDLIEPVAKIAAACGANGCSTVSLLESSGITTIGLRSHKRNCTK